jgi:hypothetical protein
MGIDTYDMVVKQTIGSSDRADGRARIAPEAMIVGWEIVWFVRTSW